MNHSAPAVEAAFNQLVAALNAQADEFKKLGGEVFHGGSPRQSQGLFALAQRYLLLRDQIVSRQQQWKDGLTIEVPPPTPPLSRRDERLERAQPGLIRNVKGMPLKKAAEKLGVPASKVKAWLEAGTLKGLQRVGGSWKVTQADLVTFAREHRDLLCS